MKKVNFSLVLFLCFNVAIRGQLVIGNAGQINIPTADLRPEGTFVGGATFMPSSYLSNEYNYNTGIYYLNLTPFKWVELTFRETLQKARQKKDDGYGKLGYYQQERSYSIKFAPLFWLKSKWCPKLVIGTNDPWSDNGGSNYSCAYGVLTKHFSFSKVGDFALSLGYSKDLKRNFKLDKGYAYSGIFGGIDYNPSFFDKLHLMVDYDGIGVNFGTNIILFKHWNIYAYGRDFKQAGFGMSYQYTIRW